MFNQRAWPIIFINFKRSGEDARREEEEEEGGKKEGKINRINALLPFLSGNFKSSDSILNSCERIQLYSTIIEIELSGSRWWQNR